MASRHVKHVTLGYARSAKTSRVDAVTDFEHLTVDRRSVFFEEALDVVAIDRLASFVAKLSRNRRYSTQIAEGDVASLATHARASASLQRRPHPSLRQNTAAAEDDPKCS